MGKWTLLTGLLLILVTVSAGAQEQSLGCYADQGDPKGTRGRDLDGYLIQSRYMTPQVCATTCGRRGFAYAGVQFGNACFCGNQYGRSETSQACNIACAGDRNQNCGGVWANAVYKAVVLPRPEGYQGCYGDAGDPFGTRGRDLGGFLSQSDDMTPKMCKQTCATNGFPYAGVQLGKACFCGESYGREGPSEACTMPCAGDPKQTCGGRWANDVYASYALAHDEPATAQEDPSASGTPVPQYLGCWQDRGSILGQLPDPDRSLNEAVTNSIDMTPCMCTKFCFEQGSTYAGLQFGRGCYCGNVEGFPGGDEGYQRYGRVDESLCTSTCAGDDSKVCGGIFTNSVWTAGICQDPGIRPDWIDPGFPRDALPQSDPAPADGETVAGGGGGGSGTPTGGSGDPDSPPAAGSGSGGGTTTPGGGSSGSGAGEGAGGGGDHPQAVPGWIGTDGRQSCISNGREVAAQLSCVAPVVTPEIGLCADPRTLEVIDAFLSQTKLWEGGEFDCWARWINLSSENGRAVARNNCQRPETDGRTRCQYLLDNYSLLESPQLGTDLRGYVLENVQ